MNTPSKINSRDLQRREEHAWVGRIRKLIDRDHPAVTAVAGASLAHCKTLAAQAEETFRHANIPVYPTGTPTPDNLTARVIICNDPTLETRTLLAEELRTARKHNRCIVVLFPGMESLKWLQDPNIRHAFTPGENLIIVDPTPENEITSW